MVQFIPGDDSWAQVGRQAGSGAGQSYMNRSDEAALQKSLGSLGPNPSARQILDTITNTKTYSPEAKQNVLKNYLGVAEFENLKKKAQKQEKREEEEFTEKKRAASVKEAQENRSLDIEEKKINKTKHDLNKVGALKSGLQTIKEMKDIGKKGNLGIGTGLRKVFSDEAAKDAGQYEQLGKSLIQLSTNIPIRNRQEFETLAHKLYDPSIRDAERDGVLTALENIINRSLVEDETEIQKETGTMQENVPEGKVRVKSKATGKIGTVTPYEGMESKYERI